ncbi:hypothetical protein HHO41_10655 [Bacillus sp. DNRA2]|uniref:hypothetical protein n=1 Tax=Bacillus sp. DNRA2 TaxID=2723053 RepID=UPI00145D5006|nr:hypothetical protein [Bacillus sp. DNRA2]NMD70753.1 hypothetical protein [Bacillus sp. DNRA2]
MEGYFFQDDRLGIPVPSLEKDWEEYNMMTQQEILFHWENIRGQIPDRISSLEKEIDKKLGDLANENDFMQSCRINNEIAELASVINDLWIWYRTSEESTQEYKLDQ